MTETVKTMIGCYFLLPDFETRGQPTWDGKRFALFANQGNKEIKEIKKDLNI